MDIRLKQLRLKNFKCHRALTLDFQGRNAGIYGDNATGKTSVYDAFVWLLFGRDSAGNGEKNIEIKPLSQDGSVRDHQAVTEVEAVLLVDGEEISLRRTLREVWSTRRGSREPSYDGNTCEYFVDGVPCKASAYADRVGSLVDEERFRMLTTVSYFSAALPWQKRREILFGLFGGLDDDGIMQTDERFQELRLAMGKLALEEFKRQVQQKRKGFLTKRNEIPARISECEKTVQDLAALDFDSADAQLEALYARRDSLSTRLLAARQGAAVQKKQLELQQTELELERLEADNRRFREEQRGAAPDCAALERELRQKNSAYASAKRALAMRKAEIHRREEDIAAARERWMRIQEELFSGSTACPTCGQPLPDAQVADAQAAFERDKQTRQDELVRKSDGYKEEKARYERETSENEAYLRELEGEISALTKRLRDMKDAAASVTVRDMEGYAGKKQILLSRLEEARRELEGLRSDSQAAVGGLEGSVREVAAEISRVSAIAGKRGAYEYAQERIGQLRQDAQAAADNLNELDKLLYLMEEYSRYKASFVEGSVNGRFRLARFRLFREQANGGVEDRCDVTYGGVPYLGLNNGMKVNVGIDIINTLSRFCGVCVPLFVDNAEAVTDLEKTDCQVIRLVVSEKDKALRVSLERAPAGRTRAAQTREECPI